MIGHTVLGKYHISRLLDKGGMCYVYLARQAGIGREVAVKLLQAPLLQEPKAIEHFQREIFIMARFSHPHAVAYYDAGQAGRAGPVLVMEYLRGVDLNSLLVREGRFAPDRVGRLLVPLCEVLQAAHTAGVVHRDLKLGNLMVLNPGTLHEDLKLMDFGLAKMTSLLYIAPDELSGYVPPTTSGTPEYISPEQINNNDGDPRSDLYSVGVMLYELLTGRLPFIHEDVDGLLMAHLNDDPPPFAAVLRGGARIPSAIEGVVRRCLAKDPRERPQTAAELGELYAQALGRRTGVVRRPPPPGEGSDAARILSTPAPAGGPGSNPPSRSQRAAGAAGEGHIVRHIVEGTMVESMAMVKLKGFIHDLGGEVVESIPGMIRVRLGEVKPEKSRGLLGWFTNSSERTARPVCVIHPPTDLEMHMERRDARQPNLLTITLVMRCRGGGMVTAEWRNRCKQIGRDLQAYLVGR
jgi:serine/threonine-protein kinase